MIPNFKGCFEYNPSYDPIKGLSKEDKDQFAFEYMQIWINPEGFCDYAIMFDSGDNELLASALVSSGAIDSRNCYPHCKTIEQRIESWAKAFNKLSNAKRRIRYNKAFKDCLIISCSTCGCIQFPRLSDYYMYEDLLSHKCWECNENTIKIEAWK